MRKRIIAGNWKQHGSTALCSQIAEQLSAPASGDPSVVICPPGVYLGELAQRLQASSIAVGGQNVAAQAEGAFTGEVAAAMLAEVGASYCIVGHSERRALYAESDEVVASKVQQLLDAGLVPILCVGEALDCREAGNEEKFVAAQLRAVFDTLPSTAAAQIVVAYEPIWAIGTGVSAEPAQVQAMHAHIRQVLSAFVDACETSLLYGGSVKPANASELLALEDVDGALVGGASLDIEQFQAIIEAA